MVGFAALGLIAVLAGCGGGGESGSDTRGAGTLSVTLQFPSVPVAPAAVPLATNSFRVQVLDAETGAPLAPDTVAARVAGATQTVRITTLPVGPVRVIAAAYESADATGETIARAEVAARVVAGATTPVRLTLGLQAHHVGLSPGTLRIEKGTTADLTATVYDADSAPLAGSYAFRWESDDHAVATVDGTGRVTAVGVGSATVTARETGTGKQATCSVSVWKREPTFAVIRAPHYRGSGDDAYFRAAFKAIAAEPDVEFILGLGDLTETGTAASMRGFKALLDETGLPYYLVKGDHENFVSAGTWATVFGSSNFTFTAGDLTFMGVDSTNGGGGVTNILIPTATLDWVRANLPATTAPLVLFTHFPLMDAGKPNAETPWWQRGRPANADALLNLFAGHCLISVLCDHWRADIEDTVTRPGAPILTGWCLSPWKANHDGELRKGYYICGYDGTALNRRFREFVFTGG